MSDDSQDFVDEVASSPEPVVNGRRRDGKFGPGNPGGPGAPRKKYFRDMFVKLLEDNPQDLEVICKELISAAKGLQTNRFSEVVNQATAAQFVKETLDGKAKQELEVTGTDEGPMIINHIIEGMGE